MRSIAGGGHRRVRPRGMAMDAATKSGTVFGIQPQVSSQEAVTVLIELKAILGYEPSSNVIKRGGYKSRDEFVRDLTTAVEQEHLKKHH